MKKPKVVIYDNDGMITHGGRFSEKYSQEFKVDPSIMSPFFEGPFKKCLIGSADLKDELRKVLETWKWRGTVDELVGYWFAVGDTLNEDIYASVAKLKQQGLIVCLATNQEKYRAAYLTEKFDYKTLFDEVFSSTELRAYKHSPEGLEKIFGILKTRHGVEYRDEIMYWDDREGNRKNLNEAGFNAQRYIDYHSFVVVLNSYGYSL